MNGAGLLALMVVATIFLYFALTRDSDGDPKRFDAWYDYKEVKHREEGMAALQRIHEESKRTGDPRDGDGGSGGT